MSDEEQKVECGVHGTSTATFLCRHLNDCEALGFNVGYDPEQPENLYPDAWCDQCDAMLEQEGEWNDRAETFAGIRLVCAECYCHIRELNWLQDEDTLHTLITGMRPAKSSTQPRKARTWCALKFRWAPVLAF